jgi:hypothetical protein
VQDPPGGRLRRQVWNLGVEILRGSGKTEAGARTIIGKWIRDHNEETVAAALGAAATRADPVAYVEGVLRRRQRVNGAELIPVDDRKTPRRAAS